MTPVDLIFYIAAVFLVFGLLAAVGEAWDRHVERQHRKAVRRNLRKARLL